MPRLWSLPEKRKDESNSEYCERAAQSIPAKDLMRAIVAYLDRKASEDCCSSWAFIQAATGHGSGISEAICERFRKAGDEGSFGV